MLRKLRTAFVVLLTLGAGVNAGLWLTSVRLSQLETMQFDLRSRLTLTIQLTPSGYGSFTMERIGPQRPVVKQRVNPGGVPVASRRSIDWWDFRLYYTRDYERDILAADQGESKAKAFWTKILFNRVETATETETLKTRATMYIPLLRATLLCVAFPCIVLAFFRLRARYRRLHGLCLNCGYNLRDSLDTERCPECGTVFGEPMLNKTET